MNISREACGNCEDGKIKHNVQHSTLSALADEDGAEKKKEYSRAKKVEFVTMCRVIIYS